MKNIFNRIKLFFKWTLQSKAKFLFELTYGLILVATIYYTAMYYRSCKLNEGVNVYTNTMEVRIDNSSYVSQLEYYFKANDSIYNIGYPKDIDLQDFDYSKTYTVRYLKEDPSYSELILIEWEEYKKQLEPEEFIEYLDEIKN